MENHEILNEIRFVISLLQVSRKAALGSFSDDGYYFNDVLWDCIEKLNKIHISIRENEELNDEISKIFNQEKAEET